MKKDDASDMSLREALAREREINEALLRTVAGNVRALMLMLRGIWVQTARGSDLDKSLRVTFEQATNLLDWLEEFPASGPEIAPNDEPLH